MAIFFDNIQVAGNVNDEQLSGYAKLSSDNTFVTGKTNTFNGNTIVADTTIQANKKLLATNDLPVAASLDSKSLIMTDQTGSYNVNYSTVKSDIRDGLVSLDGNLNISGAKTFTGIVPLVTGTPSNDNDVATVGYINSHSHSSQVELILGEWCPSETGKILHDIWINLSEDIKKYSFLGFACRDGEIYGSGLFPVNSINLTNTSDDYHGYYIPCAGSRRFLFKFKINSITKQQQIMFTERTDTFFGVIF